MSQVTIKRLELPAPTLDDPTRRVVQIQYRQGELPPRFLYINKAEWSEEKETKMIRADIKQRESPIEEQKEI